MLRSVLFRLMVSYTGLVFVLAIWTSAASYFFFQKRYNEELERIHLLKVRSIADDFSSKVIDYGKRIYLDTATELLQGTTGAFFGEDDGVAGNHAKLFLTYQSLGTLVGKYGESVESISLYYRKANVYLSFPFGIHFGDDPTNASYLEPFLEFLGQKTKMLWTNRPGATPALYRLFPILAEGDSGTVVVSVGFRPEVLRTLISADLEGPEDWRYLLDAEGKLICASSDATWNELFERELRRLPTESAEGSEARIVDLAGDQRLLVAHRISDSGWRLVAISPAKSLYSKGDSIRTTLALICAAAILLGLIISTFLSARIYNPLERLLVRIRQLFGADIPAPAGVSDEYGIIGYTIDGLATALDRSRPLIKQEVAAALLSGDIGRWGDPEETLSALRMGPFPQRMAACLVKVRPKRDELGDIEHRLLRYRIAELFEATEGWFALACVLPSGEIGLVRGGTEPDDVAEGFAEALKEIGEKFEADAWISVGETVSAPRSLRESFETARRVAAYAYFYPQRRLFSASDGFLARERKSAALDAGIFETLGEGLRRHDFNLAASAMGSAMDFARSDRASADACRRELARLARSLAEVQAELLPAESAAFRELAETAIASSADIQEFQDAVFADIALFNEKSAPSQEARLASAVAEVKRIIDGDLGGDLSLSRLGNSVGLSPGYLGKAFAAVAGTHLVDYVTERRLAEAARLLRESGDDVQAIGRLVGFNSPAYFIRRFKERFGRTPYDYRRAASGTPKAE
jgi:AraC-like DNA-binding protein